MKSSNQFLLAITFLFFITGTSDLFAQAPHLFNYQGIARDQRGNPLSDHNLSIKLSVLPAADAAEAEYVEIQQVHTNEFGLYTLQIGGGTALKGVMKNVKWEDGNKYIRVAIDVFGNTDFKDAGTTQLLSVPYAIYADRAGTAQHDQGKTRTGTVTSNAAHVAGDVNYLTKFTALNTIGKSMIYDNGTSIGIGTANPSALTKVHMLTTTGNVEHLRMQNTNATGHGKFIMYNDEADNYATFTKYGSLVPGGYPGAASQFPYANLLAFGNNVGPFLLANNGNIGLGIVTAGTTKLYINAQQNTGYLGIGGTFVPAANVHFGNIANGDTLRITNASTGHLSTDGLEISNTGNAAHIMNRENSSLGLGTNNAQQLTISSAGNVGVGTNVPAAKLDVNGTLKVSDGTQGAGKILVSDASGMASWSSTSGAGIISGSGSSGSIPKFTGANTLGTSIITDNGSEIGIGTNPATGSTLNIGVGAGNDSASISFRSAGAGNTGTFFINSLGQLQYTPNTGSPAGGTPVFTLDDDGGGAFFSDKVTVGGGAAINGRTSIGPGIVNPLASLHVRGDGVSDTAAYFATNNVNNLQIGVLGHQANAGFGTGVAGIGFGGAPFNTSLHCGVYGASADLGVWSNGTMRITDGTQGAGKVLVSAANGNASWRTNIGFNASSTVPVNIASGANVNRIYGTVNFNDGGAYNPATGEFTAPADGVYQFNYSEAFGQIAVNVGHAAIKLTVNGNDAPASVARETPNLLSQGWSVGSSVTLKLNAGDVVRVVVSNVGIGVAIITTGFNLNGGFSGFRLY